MNANTTTATKTDKKIRIVATGKSVCTDRLRRSYEPEMKLEFVGLKAAEVEKATKLCNLKDAYRASRMLETAEALKDAGYTVTIAKDAMANAEIAKIFNADKPGAKIGWVTRSTSYGTTYYITCVNEDVCIDKFNELCSAYHPCGYGTRIESRKAVDAGFMIKVTRSNSCD